MLLFDYFAQNVLTVSCYICVCFELSLLLFVIKFPSPIGRDISSTSIACIYSDNGYLLAAGRYLRRRAYGRYCTGVKSAFCRRDTALAGKRSQTRYHSSRAAKSMCTKTVTAAHFIRHASSHVWSTMQKARTYPLLVFTGRYVVVSFATPQQFALRTSIQFESVEYSYSYVSLRVSSTADPPPKKKTNTDSTIRYCCRYEKNIY